MASTTVQDVPDALEESATREHVRTDEPRSILSLRGLGKETWAGVDAVEYVRAERDAWT